WEQTQFDDRVVDIFGYTAVQLGLPQIDALRANRMPHVLRAGESVNDIGPQGPTPGEAVQGSVAPARPPAVLMQFEELPFASQSIDLLVLPHSLELSPEPHRLLREAERVLVPEGKLLVTCFNPYSLWGVRQRAGRLAGTPF